MLNFSSGSTPAKTARFSGWKPSGMGPGGQTVNQVVDWAEGELESYNRT